MNHTPPPVGTAVMPPAPPGTVWKLTFSPREDRATLWLYQRSSWRRAVRLEELIDCASVCLPYPYSLKPSTATVDQIIEGVVMSAHRLIEEQSHAAESLSDVDAKAGEVARRLGIEVEIKR